MLTGGNFPGRNLYKMVGHHLYKTREPCLWSEENPAALAGASRIYGFRCCWQALCSSWSAEMILPLLTFSAQRALPPS